MTPLSKPDKVRARFLFREVNERGFDLPLASVTAGGGVEFRDDLNISVWNPGSDTSLYKRVRPGDFVIGLRSFQSGIGHSAIEGLVSPAYAVLRPVHPDVHEAFFRHYFKSDLLISQLENVAQGIRQGRTIATEDFYDLLLPVPSREEQRAIADFLDRETARIDALITKKRHLRVLAEERFESIVYDAVRGVVTSPEEPRKPSGLEWLRDIPQHWTMPPVGANFEVILGKMVNPEATTAAEPFPYLRNTNVKWDSFDMSDLAMMAFSPTERLKYSLRKKDLLVCEGGEVGRAAIWDQDHKEVFFQKAVHRVRPRCDASTRFLMYCLRAAAKREVFRVEGNQATIVHLTAEKLRVHRFPWPSPAEQGQIVSQLDAERDALQLLASRLDSQVSLLQEHRHALITATVTGQLNISSAA